MEAGGKNSKSSVSDSVLAVFSAMNLWYERIPPWVRLCIDFGNVQPQISGSSGDANGVVAVL